MKFGMIGLLCAAAVTGALLATPNSAAAYDSRTKPAHPIRYVSGTQWQVRDIRAIFSNRRLRAIALRCSVRVWFEEYRPVWTWDEDIEAFRFTDMPRVATRKWKLGPFRIKVPAARYVYYWGADGALRRKLVLGRAHRSFDGWKFRHSLGRTLFSIGWYLDEYGEFPWRYASDNGYIVDQVGNFVEVGTEFDRPNRWHGIAFQPSAPAGPVSTNCVRA